MGGTRNRAGMQMRDVPDTSGNDIVDDTDATTPMIENANAIVSNSCHVTNP